MSSIRSRWTTLILHTTAFIQRKKNTLVTTHALSAFFNVIAIIAAEIFLGIISFPMYLIAKPVGQDTADRSEYHIRRTMTLSVIVVIAGIWLVKLLFILGLSIMADARYSIRETETQRDGALPSLTAEIAIAPTDKTIARPTITDVKQNSRTTVTIEGQSDPNAVIAVFLTGNTDPSADSGSVHMYADRADSAGRWSLTENENIFSLPPGEYVASAVQYHGAEHVKSAPSHGVAFALYEGTMERFLRQFDMALNIAAAIFLVVGVGGIVLML